MTVKIPLRKDVETFLEKGTILEGSLKNRTHYFPLRVAYKDTDAGGVVYHGNYITWAERARVALWFLLQSADHSDYKKETKEARRVMEEDGVWVVRSVKADYLAPARIYDEIMVETQITKVGNTSMTFTHTVKRKNETLAKVEIVLVWLTRATFRPTRIPEYWREHHKFIQTNGD